MSKNYILLSAAAIALAAGTNASGQSAPSPGGVPGETVWLKPSVSGTDINFKDASIYNQPATVTKYLGFPKVASLNFNPAVEFSPDPLNTDRITVAKKKNFARSTIIGAYQSSEKNSDRDILRIKKAGARELTISTDKIKKNNGEQDLDYGSTTGQDLVEDDASGNFVKPRIVSYYRLTQPRYGVWGEGRDPRDMVFSETDSKIIGNLKFGGLIPEVVVYDRVLTPGERLRVESYLAVRYGVHLVGNYTRSDEMVVWDKGANTAFHNRVAGIGRDAASGMLQARSTSSYENPRNLLTISRTLYEKDATNSCTDCVKYGLLNSNNAIQAGNNITKVYDFLTMLTWGNNGGFVDRPLNEGDYITFKYKTAGNTGAFVGVSGTDVDQNWTTAEYGIKKESNNKLSWCKSGQCTDLGINYTGQAMKIALSGGGVEAYADNALIKSEPAAAARPLFPDFTLKETDAAVLDLQVHKKLEAREFSDKEYAIWGDNGKALDKNSAPGITGLTTLNRVWKVQKTADNQQSPLYTTVEFEKQPLSGFLPSSGTYEYYLVVDKKGEGIFNDLQRLSFIPVRVIPQKAGTRLFAFEVPVDADMSGADAFTLGYSSTFLATVKTTPPPCATGKGRVEAAIVTGRDQVPVAYQLIAQNNSVAAQGTISNADAPAIIDGVAAGEYTLKLTNKAGKVSQQAVSMAASLAPKINIPDRVNITHTGSITLNAAEGQQQQYTYEWYGPNGLAVQSSPTITITTPGTYTAKATVSPECSFTKSVVVEKTNIQELQAYPVPSKVMQEFTVKATLYTPETASMRIYDMNGFLVTSKDRTVTSTEHIFTTSLPRIGVYKIIFITPTSTEDLGIIIEP